MKNKKTMNTEIQEVFDAQLAHQWAVANTSARERIKKLDKLLKAIMVTYRQDIRDAIYADFKKSQAEVDLTEIYMLTTDIKHTKKYLRSWMQTKKVPTPLPLIGSSSFIKYEPKGVCLIISPWNFPLNLTLGPLISAISAGNTAIIKPSEHTPNTSAVMKTMIEDLFPSNEVALFTGGIETAQQLLSLPFNHIFFTGSPAVGKIVMEAAAKNLSSVTLELGGKSPTVVDDSANIEVAAKRIAWGKFLNNGQICIAPDYLLVHKTVKDQLLESITKHIKIFYSENPQNEPAYNRMVNQKHLDRVRGYLEDSLSKGAKLFYGNKDIDDRTNYFEPTIVTDVPKDSELLTEEIFGPVLPVITFEELNEAVAFINGKEKPLSMYIFSKNKKSIKYLLDHTRAGGGCINHTNVHYFNMNLPFGGVNNSGIGKSHGYFGFLAFTNQRGIYRQNFPGALEFLLPPYNKIKEKIVEMTIKWF